MTMHEAAFGVKSVPLGDKGTRDGLGHLVESPEQNRVSDEIVPETTSESEDLVEEGPSPKRTKLVSPKPLEDDATGADLHKKEDPPTPLIQASEGETKDTPVATENTNQVPPEPTHQKPSPESPALDDGCVTPGSTKEKDGDDAVLPVVDDEKKSTGSPRDSDYQMTQEEEKLVGVDPDSTLADRPLFDHWMSQMERAWKPVLPDNHLFLREKSQFMSAPEEAREFVIRTLLFFSSIDEVIGKGLGLIEDICESRNEKSVMGFQKTIEDVHDRVYKTMIQVVIPGEEDRKNRIQEFARANQGAWVALLSWITRTLQPASTSSASGSSRGGVDLSYFLKTYGRRVTVLYVLVLLEGVLLESRFSIFSVLRESNFGQVCLPTILSLNLDVKRDEGFHTVTWMLMLKKHSSSKVAPLFSDEDFGRFATSFLGVIEPVCRLVTGSGFEGLNSNTDAPALKYLTNKIALELGHKVPFEEVLGHGIWCSRPMRCRYRINYRMRY